MIPKRAFKVMVQFFRPMDHLFYKVQYIRWTILCYADTSWTTSRNCIAHRWS